VTDATAGQRASLGILYNNGEGVPQDYVLAHMWLNLSAARGVVGAAANRDRVARGMLPAQIAEAQKLAREWKRRNSRRIVAEISFLTIPAVYNHNLF
jgi:TPR repeat protein